MKNIIMAAMASASLLVSPAAMASEPYISASEPHPFVFTGTFDVVKSIPISACEVVFKILGPDDSTDNVAFPKHARYLPWNAPNSTGYYHTDVNNMEDGDISLAFSNGDPNLCEPGVVYISYDHATYVGGVFTLHDVYIDTPLTPGGCRGDLPMTWSQSGQTLTASGSLPDAVAPGIGLPCIFSGVLHAQQTTIFSSPGDPNH